MPIYEFRCPACGRVLETLCKIGDDGSQLHCPGCGSGGLQRLLSTFNSNAVPGGKSCPTGCAGNCSSCH